MELQKRKHLFSYEAVRQTHLGATRSKIYRKAMVSDGRPVGARTPDLADPVGPL